MSFLLVNNGEYSVIMIRGTIKTMPLTTIQLYKIIRKKPESHATLKEMRRTYTKINKI